MDLFQIPSVINHFRNISKLYKVINSTELQIHCPFCDDASRKNAQSHGHLYISTNKRVFYCFRCGISGSIVKLLLYTDFMDSDIIKLLTKNINYKFIKNIEIKNTNFEYVKRKIMTINGEFSVRESNLFRIYKNYIYKRIGEYVNFVEYLLAPKILNRRNLSCQFYNANLELITSRYINNNKYRYKKNSNSLYYFQKKDFTKYNKITITEGGFDAINLDLYGNFKNNYFISMQGKKYITTIEDLILNDLLIGEYKINLIYDQDFKFKRNNLKKCQTIARQLNPNINIEGYTSKFKDVAEFCMVEKINVE